MRIHESKHFQKIVTQQPMSTNRTRVSIKEKDKENSSLKKSKTFYRMKTKAPSDFNTENKTSSFLGQFSKAIVFKKGLERMKQDITEEKVTKQMVTLNTEKIIGRPAV
jgi:hypothetical protein